jgi:Tol biopolymer transport system component/DNA-binding winged helix-turn-helix (wHTH) protein
MRDGETQPASYRFGNFELDTRPGELRKNGTRIRLQDQPLQILRLLLENAGELVTREQIQKKFWASDTFVDFDNAINSAMRKLREALSDDSRNPRFIETFARRGYRFIAPVSVVPSKAPVSLYASVPAPPPAPVTEEAKSPGVSLRPRWVIGAAALVLIAAGLGVAWWLRNSEITPVAELKVTPLTSYPGYQDFPSFSPDGTRVVFAWGGAANGQSNLYVKLIGPGDPVRLTMNERDDFSPAWSPDGRVIAFLRRKDGGHVAVLVMPALGGPARELTTLTLINWIVVPPPFVAWSADGKWLFTVEMTSLDTAATRDIVCISVETGEKRTVISAPRDTIGDGGLAISPDGNTLAFAQMRTLAVGDMYAVPLSKEQAPARQPERLTFDDRNIVSLAWTADGQDLVFSSARSGRLELWRIPVLGSNKPTRVVGAGDEPSELAVSPQGHRLVYAHGTGNYHLWRSPLAGNGADRPTDITTSTRRQDIAQYSSDGRHVAFESDRSGSEEIWVTNADGSSPAQLTSMGAWSGSPRWSTDSERIAFDGTASGHFEIYAVSANGGKPVRLTWDGKNNVRPSWSHDGKWIYYVSRRTGRDQIWKMGVSGKPEIQVTKSGSDLTAFESADGETLYYKKEEGLWKVPVGGGNESKVAESLCGYCFTPAKRGIYFLDRCGDDGILHFLDYRAQASKPLPSLGRICPSSVSPDERWVLHEEGSGGSDLMLVENFH